MAVPLSPQDLDHVVAHASSLENLRGARVFITGGTGFFGCWLLESFVHANRALGLGAQATVLTRDPQRFAHKMPHLAECDELLCIPGDVRAFDGSNCELEIPVTHVIHAAAASGATPEECSPELMYETIIEGTKRLLDFALARGAQKFLFVSSGAVYGTQPPSLSHIDEEYRSEPGGTSLNSYGEGKRAAEWLCAAYHENDGLDVSIARCFAFVGPHLPLDVHFAIGNFLRDALNGGPIRIGGDGTPFRSYLYMADLAVWLWEILLRGDSGRAYNVGSEHAVSILETARAVAAAFDPSPEITVAKQPQEGVLPSRYVPSTARARNELGLEQKVSLPDAIERTLRYQKSTTGVA